MAALRTKFCASWTKIRYHHHQNSVTKDNSPITKEKAEAEDAIPTKPNDGQGFCGKDWYRARDIEAAMLADLKHTYYRMVPVFECGPDGCPLEFDIEKPDIERAPGVVLSGSRVDLSYGRKLH